MKAYVIYKDKPLHEIDLQGLHLIEASAGTGKTWTLSSLMVRILTEKYMPRQVIATTFTRAAAAELKSRIRLRLQEMQQHVEQWSLLDIAMYDATLAMIKDPLAQILFTKFKNLDGQIKGFDYLDNRLKLVIDSLDELFVGTIDSFTQKLLREFSFESGEIIPRQLTEQEQHYPYQIVHDVLRAWLMQQSQELVDLLLISHSLKTVDAYVETVSKTLNFAQAKLQPVDYPQFSLDRIQYLIAQLIAFESDPERLKDYRADGVFAPYLKKQNLIELIGDVFPKWQAQLKDVGIYAVFTGLKTDGSFTKQMQGLTKSLFSTNQKLTKAYFEEQIIADAKANGMSKTQWEKDNIKQYQDDLLADLTEPLMQHGLVPILIEFFNTFEHLKQHLTDLDHYLRYYLSIEVKKRLPNVLLQAGETTFNQQTRTLREALDGEKGQQFATAVLQRYPIILVDEFQDTSQEQDNILKSIWRQEHALPNRCFIAVGDPKQAIYGFRGGDILTYINAFNDIAYKKGQFYRLKYNFRSVKNLVEVLDQLFDRQPEFGEEVDYYTALSGNAQLKPLQYKGSLDTKPLKSVFVPKGANEEYIVARKIRELLILGQKGELTYEQDGKHYPIKPEDIAILAKSQRELDLVQKQLESIHIQVNRATLTSVFSSASAQHIGAILHAILSPDQEPKLKRALLSPALGLTLQDFENFENEPEQLNLHLQNFRHTRQIWLTKGFLTAWQWLADHYHIWQNLATHEADQAERAIVNTRHLIELISQKSYYYQGIQHLLHWYHLQLSSPQQRDWELERKLSSASGVQLMTIHKSKGLEFKIVFLMSANKRLTPTKNKAGDLGFFEQQHQQQAERLISVSPQLIKEDGVAYAKHLDKKTAEDHRLWYVALTRASYAIYLMFNEITKNEGQAGGADFWFQAQEQPFVHEGYIEDQQDLLHLDYTPTQLEHLKLDAILYPKTIFYPKNRTSFSYLAVHQHAKPTLDALAEYSPTGKGAHDEQQNEPALMFVSEEQQQPLSWIQQHFPKGAQAGNCLHGLLEDIDFQNTQQWERDIQRHLTMHSMWQPLMTAYQKSYGDIETQEQIRYNIKQQIKIWLEQIVHTPIHQYAEEGFSLNHLNAEQRLSEFEFYLTLANTRFESAQLHQLFKSYGYDMPEFEQAKSARYLNGAIDLTYFDGQKFHIADYKSNYLGETYQHYTAQHIAQSMTQASYWLQAGLYLVALHRHLKVSLAGYLPEQHLGSANYLYLRGMQAQQDYGVQHWQPPLDLILELDQCLGQHLILNVNDTDLDSIA